MQPFGLDWSGLDWIELGGLEPYAQAGISFSRSSLSLVFLGSHPVNLKPTSINNFSY